MRQRPPTARHPSRKLIDALRPFAREADEWSDEIDGRYQPGITEPRKSQAHAKAVFALRHLRRARQLVREFDAAQEAQNGG